MGHFCFSHVAESCTTSFFTRVLHIFLRIFSQHQPGVAMPSRAVAIRQVQAPVQPIRSPRDPDIDLRSRQSHDVRKTIFRRPSVVTSDPSSRFSSVRSRSTPIHNWSCFEVVASFIHQNTWSKGPISVHDGYGPFIMAARHYSLNHLHFYLSSLSLS